MWQDITQKDKQQWNSLATHPLQSYEWGEFRKATGITVVRKGFFEKNKLTQIFQLTIHPIPYTLWTIGYLPKGDRPTSQLIEELKKVGKQYRCIFIQLEPNIIDQYMKYSDFTKLSLIPAAHPLFTKHTFHIDLTKPEGQLLAAMHPKARYNIKVAQKHHVAFAEDNSQKGFDAFWKLTQETTSRQQFFAHTKKYHLTQWQSLPHIAEKNMLSSHILFTLFDNKPLTAWIVFIFNDMLYYPYGASSQEHRETMHSTLMMWEAIRFGKKYTLKTFDLWGAAAPNTLPSDPWFGFTQFKERFGPTRVTFVGSYDLVINSMLYQIYKFADKLRWLLLKKTLNYFVVINFILFFMFDKL